MNKLLLQINQLSTSFLINDQFYPAVDDVSFDVCENEILAIVGESGCGKSALALSILGLHNEKRTKTTGEIIHKGSNLVQQSPAKMNKIRGKEIGMIFQEPLTALNPLMTIGKQIEENLNYHTSLTASAKKKRVLQLLSQVGIPNPKITYKQYPHELSGGMRQRAMISIAIACNPSIIIADEPTTALDVTIQAQILDLLKDIQKETKMGIVLITHDLSVVAEVADRVAVMYAGQIIEIGDVKEIFKNPLHPYTRSLLNSIPTMESHYQRLHVIEGIVPSLDKLPRNGCRFSLRTPWISSEAHENNPTLREITPNHYVRCTCYNHFHFRDEQGGVQSNDTIKS
ncbi:MAG: ABC transporter ATP-binding protein [Bacillaceae bacterium]